MAAGQPCAPEARLNWRCEFRDPTLEALYRRTMLSQDACQLRHAVSVTAGLYLVFSLADYALLGLGEAFVTLGTMRLAVATACVVLAVAVWCRPALAHHVMPVNLLCLIGLSGLLLTIPLRPEPIGIHVASMLFASMVLYLFLPNRLPWILAWNAYLVVGFVLAVRWWATLTPGLAVTSLLLLGFINLLGWLTSTRLSRLQRQQFASLLEERNTNRRLQAEIEERRTLELRLRHMASIDELTGIANRRHFFELAERELSRSRRDGTPLAIGMIDIDLFKNLNDRHGHAVGDRALAAVAACCQSVLRDTDIIGRYGGEEFVIALPQADRTTAVTIGERLRDKVSQLSLPPIDAPGQISVTVGISLVGSDERRLDPVLQRADRALYEGKARGRNCVVVSGRDVCTEAVKKA